MAAEGYSEDDLFKRVYDRRFKRVMASLVERTWMLFDMGYPLIESVEWLLSKELAFTWLGGTTILERTRRSEYDVFAHRPKLSKIDFVRLGILSLLGIRSRRDKLKTLFENHPK
jgi:hypothetical protein